MKQVLILNGSPHEQHGNTGIAIAEVTKVLSEHNINADVINLGVGPFYSCKGCHACHKSGECIFDDVVNEIGAKASDYDGLILASPVHYAGISGALKSVLDRLFFAYSAQFAYKPGFGLVCARRAGTTAALEQLNKYFQINHMPIISSSYWVGIHGAKPPADATGDAEGLQVLRHAATNLANYLNSGLNLKDNALVEDKVRTNFVKNPHTFT